MPNNSYIEKLKDPRWQKKRLEIMERDEFKCQKCHNPENTLHIHHFAYIKDKDPWDYPSDYLITLCEDCHYSIGNGNDIQDLQSFFFRLYRHNLRNGDCFVDDLNIIMYNEQQYGIYVAIGEIIKNSPINIRLIKQIALLFMFGRVPKSYKDNSVDKWYTFNGVFGKLLKAEDNPNE